MEVLETREFASDVNPLDKIASLAGLNEDDKIKLQQQLDVMVDECNEAVSNIIGNNYPDILSATLSENEDDDLFDEIYEQINKYIRKRV